MNRIAAAAVAGAVLCAAALAVQPHLVSAPEATDCVTRGPVRMCVTYTPQDDGFVVEAFTATVVNPCPPALSVLTSCGELGAAA